MGAEKLAIAEAPIYRVETIPPPDGEDDAYSATTKVGPLSTAQIANLMQETDESAPASAVRAKAVPMQPQPPDARPFEADVDVDVDVDFGPHFAGALPRPPALPDLPAPWALSAPPPPVLPSVQAAPLPAGDHRSRALRSVAASGAVVSGALVVVVALAAPVLYFFLFR